MILNFFAPNFFTKQFLVMVSNISTPLLILWIKSLLIKWLTLTMYSFSWLFLARSILFTISPSLVKKINPSLGLSNLPIGKILVGYLMKSIMLSCSTLLSVVQTIPTGLLKAKYIFCFVDFSILWPSTFTWSPSSTLLPFCGILPLMTTFPSSISLSATLLEPVSYTHLTLPTILLV